jgi:hypothetical protein
LLIDNSGIEPHEVFAINGGVVQSFDIDNNQALHKLFEAKVCKAYHLMRVLEGLESR